jgi:signal transduction histidine kinase
MTARRRLRRSLHGRPLLADTLLAGAIYLLVLLALVAAGPADRPPSLPLTLLWEALAVSTLVLRRRDTRLAVGLLTLHTVVALAVPRFLQVEAIAIVVMTYTAAVYLTMRAAVLATAALWGPGLVAGLTVLDPRHSPVHLQPVVFAIVTLLALLVAFLVGRTVHHRRAFIVALEGRARDAEENQQAVTERAVAEERRRIARELHDMVAHHVSVMGVLATASRRTLRRDPDAADEALATIEETGRTALREMRRLLVILRSDQEPVGELAPQPGLAHLSGLVEQVREAGLPVTLTVDGDGGTLDQGVSLTVYRIVQEALTNALKHAGAAVADVRLEIGTYWLTLDVSDTGRGPRLDGGRLGHGLLGMRERVTLYGGTLRTGPRPGSGFRVSARIPVEASDGAVGS